MRSARWSRASRPAGPAEPAQIQPGDVILEFDHKPIDRMRGLPRIVAETPIGKEVEVVVWRRGERSTFGVTLGELPEEEELAALTEEGAEVPASSAAIDALGVTRGDASPRSCAPASSCPKVRKAW